MLKKLLYFAVVLLAMVAIPVQADDSDIFNVTTPTRVSVHDPSIVVGYKQSDGKITGEKTSGASKVYYIFGSHRAWAKSTDMQNWKTFENNINTNYAKIFSKDAEWSAKGGTQSSSTGSYDVTGNLWAPDVIWNKAMKKWCMYMSVNGDNYYSSIVMLTAESLEGDWTRVGTVVYSGFTSKSEAQATDFYKVYSGSDFPSRYTLKNGDYAAYSMNAIDPCVFYDESGNLWMTYGSWFGGLYILRLDAKTGLRDYTYTYETTDGTAAGATSDVYQGIKVAGGNNVSGEASYVQYINGKYYLFVTYGGLTATGGYNMRVFSSTSPTGPYTDIKGIPAIYSSKYALVGNVKRKAGSQLMNYYKWNLMDYGYCAEGHNSVLVDDDGKIYLVYHTRSTTWGDGHQVRVHQMFVAENGELVAAPFEYRGETLSSSAYSKDEVVGKYNIIFHENTDYTKLECNDEIEITLNADGTIDSEKRAYRGTWSMSSTSPYITITFKGMEDMQGVLVKQKMEGLNYETLCFTAISTYKVPLWGYKNVDDVISQACGTDKCPVKNILAQYSTISEFNDDYHSQDINSETGLSLSFYVSGLDNDWTLIGLSTDEKYKMYLSVLHYNTSDFYEAKATISEEAIAAGYTAATAYEAFLNGSYYATVSFNPDGTVGYYRDGKLMLTYAADATPSYPTSGSNVTPATVSAAAINYYLFDNFDFSRNVYNIIVGYSVPYDSQLPSGINSVKADSKTLDVNAPMYNLSGQHVGKDYKGLVIQNGKKIYVK